MTPLHARAAMAVTPAKFVDVVAVAVQTTTKLVPTNQCQFQCNSPALQESRNETRRHRDKIKPMSLT